MLLPPRPTRAALLAGLLACPLLAVACATNEPLPTAPPLPPAAPQAAHAGAEVEDTTIAGLADPKAAREAELAGYVPKARKEKRVPPPTRRRRDYLLDEKRYVQLMKQFPRGFRPDDCKSLCQQPQATAKSDDGEWNYVLRCVLNRNMRDEPVVSCREDAVDDAGLEKLLGR